MVSVVRPDLQDVQVVGCAEEDIATLTSDIANPQNSPLNLTVNWGDGDQVQYVIDAGATSLDLTHYYQTYGANGNVDLQRRFTPLASSGADRDRGCAGPANRPIQPCSSNRLTLLFGGRCSEPAREPEPTYAWTLTESGSSTPVETGSSQEFDSRYRIRPCRTTSALVATEGCAGGPGGTPVNGSQAATATASIADQSSRRPERRNQHPGTTESAHGDHPGIGYGAFPPQESGGGGLCR